MRPDPTDGKMSKLLARLLSSWQLLHLHIMDKYLNISISININIYAGLYAGYMQGMSICRVWLPYYGTAEIV